MKTRVAGSVLALTVLAGTSAPWLAQHVLGFSPAEQHTGLQFAAPGAQDVSLTWPTYDGDPAGFSLLDRDGDGALGCERGPTGGARCPEIAALVALWRPFDLLIELHDRDGDSALSLSEFPSDDKALDPRLQAPAGQVRAPWPTFTFAALDTDGDGKLRRAGIIAGTRAARLDAAHLLRNFDEDGDFSLQKAEFPGSPRLRTAWLGMDGAGRDLLTRLLFGARMSLWVGLLATAVALLIGTAWGAIAGYFGGRLDNLMMRVVDLLYGLPFMFIVILLLVVAGRSTTNLFIALGAVSWLNMARIVRGQVRSVREESYVLAAQAIGAGPLRIIWREILPATAGPILVTATLMVPAVIIEEALLSFLGLGVQPPESSWGTLIAEGAGLMANHPWLITWPAAMLGTTLLALNFLGDGLRDALDED